MAITEDTTMSISFFFTLTGVIATALYAYFGDKNNVTKINERINSINENVDTLTLDTEKRHKEQKDNLTSTTDEIKTSTKEREDNLENKLETFKSKHSVEMIELKKNINDERTKITEIFFKRIDDLKENLKNLSIELTELATKIIHLEENKNTSNNNKSIEIELAVLKEKFLNLNFRITEYKEELNNKLKIIHKRNK